MLEMDNDDQERVEQWDKEGAEVAVVRLGRGN